MTKREAINNLYHLYMKEFFSKEIVLGDGNIDTKLLLIGEAPGKDEVKLSKPFVGAAGKNLMEFLELLGIDRESIYITNAIKFRLSQVNSETGRIVNRPATRKEIAESREYLLNEISIIKPEFIVTLGNVPLKSVIGEAYSSIGDVHGEIKSVTIHSLVYNLFPLYHPASVIYNRSLKEIYINDIKKLKVVLG